MRITSTTPKSPAMTIGSLTRSDHLTIQPCNNSIVSAVNSSSLTELNSLLGLVRFHQGCDQATWSWRNLSATSSSLDQTFDEEELHRTTGFSSQHFMELLGQLNRRRGLFNNLTRPGHKVLRLFCKEEDRINWELQDIIDQSQRIAGGAGVSTESNIPDFRSSDGVYSDHLGRHFTAEQLVSLMFGALFRLFHPYKACSIQMPASKCSPSLSGLAEETGKLKAAWRKILTAPRDGGVQKSWNSMQLTVITVRAAKALLCDLEAFRLWKDCSTLSRLWRTTVRDPLRGTLDMDVLAKPKPSKRLILLIIGGTSSSSTQQPNRSRFQGEKLVVINKTSIPGQASRPGHRKEDWPSIFK